MARGSGAWSSSKRRRSISTRGEPAISHIRAALAGGAHVVTANKGPVAFAYRALARAARRAPAAGFCSKAR